MNNRFVVDLSGVKLSKEQSRQIETGIQKSVLESIAVIRFDFDIRLRFPREWIGIILNPDIGGLAEIEKTLAERLRF